MFYFVLLISFSIIILRFMHVVHINSSFLVIPEWCSTVYTTNILYHNFFTHSYVDGHLSVSYCIELLGIFVYKSLCGHRYLLPLGKYLGLKWLGHMGGVIWLLRKLLVLQSSCTISYFIFLLVAFKNSNCYFGVTFTFILLFQLLFESHTFWGYREGLKYLDIFLPEL